MDHAALLCLMPLAPSRYNGAMLEINGSYGEGGGQILRTALSLSCVVKIPFRLYNIRKGRMKPGLMPQHLTCVHALTRISGATVQGGSLGSTELVFEPKETMPGDYFFDIGTAGSTTLLLQSILPALVFANAFSSLTLKGGTHVPFSPPYHFISEVFIPVLRGIGIPIDMTIGRYGFYPKGGGDISVRIYPHKGIKGLTLTNRGEGMSVAGISAVANLPASIADRQKAAAEAVLRPLPIQHEIKTAEVPSFGQGTFVFLKAETQHCIAGFSALGGRGKRAEAVGEEAGRAFLSYYATKACIDQHLADQLALYLCLAEGASVFTTSGVTNHLLTNLRVIGQFLKARYSVDGDKGKPGKIMIFP